MSTAADLLPRALEYHRSGCLEDAGKLYAQVLQTEPRNADALHLLGLVYLQAGKQQAAVELIRKAVEEAPNQPYFRNSLGEAYRALGMLEQATSCYSLAIELNRELPEPYNNMGIVFHKRGNYKEAIACYEKALELRAGYIEALCNMGGILKETGKAEESIPFYERVLALRPDFPDACRSLGEAFGMTGRLKEEIALYRRAIDLNCESPEIWAALGAAYQRMERINEAIEAYGRALTLKPVFPEVLSNLGTVLRIKGRPKDAMDCFEQSLVQRPGNAQTLNNAGVALYEDDRFQEALAFFARAVQADPCLAAAYSNRGMVYAELGDVELARESYDKAISLVPKAGLKVKAAALMPVVIPSKDAIAEIRQGFMSRIEGLAREGITIDNPVRELGKSHFYLAYHGCNDREIQEMLGRFYRHACPSLDYVAPHCLSRRGMGARHKIRIGFVSRHLYDHTVGKYMKGIIANLDRSIFSVHTFSLPFRADATSHAIGASSDVFLMLDPLFSGVRQRIADHELDLLFYTDIGMEPFTYFLGFSRLAPVQCAFYGHPVTTGIDTIDYFISQEDCEIAGSAYHYTERLVTLSNKVAYTFFSRPRVEPFTRGRNDFGIPASAHVYFCPQSLFKIHPDFDDMASRILNEDPNGVLLLVKGKHDRWTSLFEKRLKAVPGCPADRIIFLPSQPYQGYLNLLALCDVVLDTPHFNGGSTTFDALAVGTPIVTMPGEFMRGRQTYSLYRRMGLNDCVARSIDEYAAKAVRLGRDREYREGIKEGILSGNYAIFEDMAMVRELENLLLSMVRDREGGAANGDRIMKFP